LFWQGFAGYEMWFFKYGLAGVSLYLKNYFFMYREIKIDKILLKG